MSGKEFLIDAIAQFLESSAWLDAVTAFLETHFRKFLVLDDPNGDAKTAALNAKVSSANGEDGAAADGDDDAKNVMQSYSLEQFDTFLLFKDLVERLLEQVIADLGCSGEDLVSVLEESARLGTHASGKRQFFIKTLLSFENYSAFHRKISQFAAEKLANGAVVLETATDTESESPEYSEWILQLAIARSILESKDRGELDVTEEGFVPWAQALVEMSQHSTDMQEESSETGEWAVDGGESKDEEAVAPALVDSRMRELERTLIRERLKVDLLVAQRIADANAQMKQQMLHLVAAEVDDQMNAADQALTGTAEENELAGLFAQIETIESRLKDVKAQCFAFTSVAQPEMDRVYLFLKEKVHYQQDLVSMESEIFDFVFTQIEERDAALVPLLLEWLLLEAEGLRVQNQIQDQLNGAHDEGYWIQNWDEGSKAFYYVHSITNESKWEAPLCGYLDMNAQVVNPSWDGYGEPPFTGSEVKFESPAEAYEDDPSAVVADSSADFSEVSGQISAQASLEEAASHLDATLQYPSDSDTSQLLEFEGIMRRISQEHEEERRRLELLFQIEKARQREELRKRKEKKRRERLAKKVAQANDADAKTVGAGVAASLETKSLTTAAQRAPPPPVLSSRLAPPLSARAVPMKAETKGGDEPHELSIMVPGHGRVDLTHLLSDSHAKRFHERKGMPVLAQQQPPLASAQAMLNPSTLRYLAEKMIQKDPANWSYVAPKQEIVIDEVDLLAADEK